MAASAPENTLAGFRLAAGRGVRWVEFDVRLTADGVPVVFHDDRLDRTTDGRGRLSGTSLETLRRRDAGRWFGQEFAGERVPTLAEALALLAGLEVGANIEIKAEGALAVPTARAALAVARQVWPAERPPPLVSSFTRAAVAAARETVPDWPRGLIVARLPGDWRRAVARLGCVSVHLDHRRLTRTQVRAVSEQGLIPVAWTVNDPARARLLTRWGVASLISDVPDRLAAALA